MEFLTGSISPSDRTALEEHLLRCSKCTSVLEEYQEIIKHLRTIAECEQLPPLPPRLIALQQEIVLGLSGIDDDHLLSNSLCKWPEGKTWEQDKNEEV